MSGEWQVHVKSQSKLDIARETCSLRFLNPSMKKTFFQTCRSIQLKNLSNGITATPEQQGTLNIIPNKTGLVEMAIECRIENIYLKFDTILVCDL